MRWILLFSPVVFRFWLRRRICPFDSRPASASGALPSLSVMSIRLPTPYHILHSGVFELCDVLFSCLVAWVWLRSWSDWYSPKLRWVRWMLNLLYFQYSCWRWFFSVVVKFPVVSGGQVLWMVRWWLQVVEFRWKLLFPVWFQSRFRRQFR